MLSMRKLQQLLNHQWGQGIVEMALLMCFAVAVVVGVNWDSFKESMGIPYQKMANYVGMKTSTTNPVDISAYATMPTSELQLVNNEERIAADKATITALGEFLLTLNKSQLKELFPNVTDKRLTGNDSNKPGVALFDYSIDNTGDNGEALRIKLRKNGTGYLSNQQAIQWMQGNFDTNTANYPKPAGDFEYAYNRFFYSNDAINPKPVADSEWEQSATLWASFSFDSAGNVTSVKLDFTRSYQTAKNTWSPDRIYCKGLSNIVLPN